MHGPHVWFYCATIACSPLAQTYTLAKHKQEHPVTWLHICSKHHKRYINKYIMLFSFLFTNNFTALWYGSGRHSQEYCIAVGQNIQFILLMNIWNWYTHCGFRANVHTHVTHVKNVHALRYPQQHFRHDIVALHGTHIFFATKSMKVWSMKRVR